MATDPPSPPRVIDAIEQELAARDEIDVGLEGIRHSLPPMGSPAAPLLVAAELFERVQSDDRYADMRGRVAQAPAPRA